MKILYVADNRDRHNWGCRATSAALSEMLQENNTIVGRISGRLTLYNDFVYLSAFAGAANSFVYSIPYGEKIFRKIFKFIPFMKADFLSYDLDDTIEKLKKYSKQNKVFAELNIENYPEFDALVINGEGTMIMSTPARRDTLYYLMLVHWALKLGKKVFFLNAMFSDCPKTGKNSKTLELTEQVLKKCTLVTCREPMSYNYLCSNTKLNNIRMIPDALFTWKKYLQSNIVYNARSMFPFGYESDENLNGVDLSKGYICVSGSSSAAWNKEVAFKSYLNLIQRIKKEIDIPVLLVEVCDGDDFLRRVAKETNTLFIPVETPIVQGLNLLAHAKVYVSGRYHPGIMSSIGGVPVVFLGSNSYKNIGLQQLLKYDNPHEFSSIPDDSEVEKIIYCVNKYLNSPRIAESVISNVVNQAGQIKDLLSGFNCQNEGDCIWH